MGFDIDKKTDKDNTVEFEEQPSAKMQSLSPMLIQRLDSLKQDRTGYQARLLGLREQIEIAKTDAATCEKDIICMNGMIVELEYVLKQIKEKIL